MSSWQHLINKPNKSLIDAKEVYLGCYTGIFPQSIDIGDQALATFHDQLPYNEWLEWALDNSCDGVYFYSDWAIQADSFEPRANFYYMVYLQPKDLTFFNLKYQNACKI